MRSFLEKHGLSTLGLVFEFGANKDICITLMENSLETITLLRPWVEEIRTRCEGSSDLVLNFVHEGHARQAAAYRARSAVSQSLQGQALDRLIGFAA